MAKTSLIDLLKHPASIATTSVAVLGGLLKLPVLLAVWEAFYATAPGLFGFLALLNMFGGQLAFIPETGLLAVTFAVGAIVGYQRIKSWYNSFMETFRKNT